ncbi:ThiF family adenylyltransferase [Janthinobacterium sp.]|uniref:ThiF family adenylyltransferase n=1 Tax=Janthinobacterium sp. TaxID=1871054 RepID=UPI002637C78C|nr:ThiF family adenylyltransferase [Janthinobacterium sp.]
MNIADLGYPVQHVKISLGALFPAIPCELYVDVALCLKIPHVEEDGRVCLDEVCQAVDFDEPVAAVVRALKRFQSELLERSSNEGWAQEQLQAERLSYWARFCDQKQKEPRGRPRPSATLVNMESVVDWAEGRIAAYIPHGTKHRRFDVQVVTLGSLDPVNLAQRHGWSSGTLVKGRAAFARLPDDLEWTPSTWPTDFAHLDALVAAATYGQQSVAKWLMRTGWIDTSDGAEERLASCKIPDGSMPLLVVLCLGMELYGYQISPSTVSLVTAPHAAPVKLLRIDPTWALIRDHAVTPFQQRQHKCVLLLGCGSLGSPIADILGRSGVGGIDIVDSQLLEPANVSRHILGLSVIRQSKAKVVAARLSKDIPGIVANGFHDDALRWMSKNCQPGKYDLILDCTAESTVRIFLSHLRSELFGDVPIVHAWVEPFCAAAHVVASTLSEPWPTNDPVRSHVNAADYSNADVRVKLPACSDGFHPYGSADILQAAGFTGERVIEVLDRVLDDSRVWSFVRTQAFFDALSLPITTNSIVPATGGIRDGVLTTRLLRDVLSSHE